MLYLGRKYENKNQLKYNEWVNQNSTNLVDLRQERKTVILFLIEKYDNNKPVVKGNDKNDYNKQNNILKEKIDHLSNTR